jgi:class 3 adenylate cyclase
VSSVTRIQHDHLRIDMVTTIRDVLPDGSFEFEMRPDPARYDWEPDDEHSRVLVDRRSAFIYPERVVATLAEQMVGAPMFAPAEATDAAVMLEQRRAAICAALDGAAPVSELADPSADALAGMVGPARTFAVVSVDLVGSTAMQANCPEDYATVVPLLLSELGETAAEFGGVIIKNTGDGVLVGFSEPGFCIAADTAFDAACAMTVVVYGALNPELQKRGIPPIAVRVGADAHQAVVQPIGASAARRTLDVMGLAVSLAAKVQGAAEAGEVWVGGCLHDLLHVSRQELLEDAAPAGPFPFVDRADAPYPLRRLRIAGRL